jgi:hypothetical protein
MSRWRRRPLALVSQVMQRGRIRCWRVPSYFGARASGLVRQCRVLSASVRIASARRGTPVAGARFARYRRDAFRRPSLSRPARPLADASVRLQPGRARAPRGRSNRRETVRVRRVVVAHSAPLCLLGRAAVRALGPLRWGWGVPVPCPGHGRRITGSVVRTRGVAGNWRSQETGDGGTGIGVPPCPPGREPGLCHRAQARAATAVEGGRASQGSRGRWRRIISVLSWMRTR